MKRIYVSHPYGGKPENKKKVEAIIKKLIVKNPGALYISPIHAIGYLYHDVPYGQGMEYCLELLRMCDEMLLCDGWEKSQGCRIEKEFAEKHGIPIGWVS